MLLLAAAALAADPLTVSPRPLLDAEPDGVGRADVVLWNRGASPVHATGAEIVGDPVFQMVGGKPEEIGPHQLYVVQVVWTRVHATLPKGSLLVHATEGTSTVKLDTTGVQPAGMATLDTAAMTALLSTTSASVTTSGEITVTGSLTRESVAPVVQQQMGAITNCYKLARSRNPAAAGQIVMRFVVNRRGTVSPAKMLSTTFADSALDSCVSTVFANLTFPVPSSDEVVIVDYPLSFAPG